MYKREQTLSYASALRSIHLFSFQLERGQFHAHLTAQALTPVPRISVFLAYQTYQYSDELFKSTITTSK